MSELVPIATIHDVSPGSHRAFTPDGRAVLVCNVDGEFYAFDDDCPHRGGSFADGTFDDTAIVCPLHGWKFDVTTGRGVDHPDAALRRYPVVVRGDELLIDLSSEVPAAWDGVHRYLVRFGAMGWIGRFGSVHAVECARGDRVLVRTERGEEAGTVLAIPADLKGDAAQPSGEILRRLTSDEERELLFLARPEDIQERCRSLLNVYAIPLEVIDCERLFDGETAVLYYLGDRVPELEKVTQELNGEFRGRVLLQPVIEPAPPVSAGGCGSGGCGSGGCGH